MSHTMVSSLRTCLSSLEWSHQSFLTKFYLAPEPTALKEGEL